MNVRQFTLEQNLIRGLRVPHPDRYAQDLRQRLVDVLVNSDPFDLEDLCALALTDPQHVGIRLRVILHQAFVDFCAEFAADMTEFYALDMEPL